MSTTLFKSRALLIALSSLPVAASAAPTCAELEAFLANKVKGTLVCFHSDDLRTNNPLTTPPNNQITTYADGTQVPNPTGLALGGAFTPVTDRGVISNGPAPTTQAVPGVQVEGWFADDPMGEARFVLRFPDDWNGKLVVAGASGTRSEYNGDWAWSDYLLPKGYAYASQNKGVLNFYIVSLTSATQPASDPLACRLNPASTVWVHFFDNDPAKVFTQWTQYMLETASLAQGAAKAAYGKTPRRTYAVGTSNGAYQVRRAIEEAPNLFDGGVDWEGTYVDADGPNVLSYLPPAIKNFPAYVASGYDPLSQAAKNIVDAGYPPDIVKRDSTTGAFVDSLWKHYSDQFWEVTACQWQERFDPTYATYAAGLGNYDLAARLAAVPGIASSLAAIESTGKIKKPLITVAGSMDALLPTKLQARVYEAAVEGSRKGNNDHRNAQYRFYEVQNGNHIESYIPLFPQLRLIQPHAQKAFDLLVDHVENKAPLPPSQCIPKDGAISDTPAQAGNCAQLLAP